MITPLVVWTVTGWMHGDAPWYPCCDIPVIYMDAWGFILRIWNSEKSDQTFDLFYITIPLLSLFKSLLSSFIKPFMLNSFPHQICKVGPRASPVRCLVSSHRQLQRALWHVVPGRPDVHSPGRSCSVYGQKWPADLPEDPARSAVMSRPSPWSWWQSPKLWSLG